MKLRILGRLEGVVAGAVASLVVLLLLAIDSSFLRLEPIFYDAASRTLAKRSPADPSVVVVSINEKSLSTLEPVFGRYQIHHRAMLAPAVAAIHRGGASVVVLDLLLSGSDGSVDDRALASAIASGPTVLGATTAPRDSRESSPPPPSTRLWRATGLAPAALFSIVAPHPFFADSAAAGTMRLASTDHSAPVRNYVTFDCVDRSQCIPSLALAAAAEHLSLPRAFARSSRETRFGEHAVPTNDEGAFLIRWKGPSRAGASFEEIAYPVVDFDKVVVAGVTLEEGDDEESIRAIEQQLRQLFEGRIVIIGLTSTGLLDLRATPLSPRGAGVQIHANAIDNLLNGEFNRPVPLLWIAIVILIAMAVLGGVLQRMRRQVAAATLAISVAAAWFVAALLLLRSGSVVPAVAPAVATLLTWAAVLVIRFLAEQRETRQLRATFGRYVSPQILEHILAHPEKVELGGERREMTILFSDIRGFTSISEAAEPEEVVEMLNEYLTRMVEILLRNGGTLDKFIGDAVMGFWNAPADEPNHAQRAVACAVEMIDETKKLGEEWTAEGKSPIRIGIGINTGEAVVGNIGSRQVFGYTVIGDAVNLASRLEGKNKDYGTEIIISEMTRDRIDPSTPTVYLDEVKVKGKEKAVRIYQVRGTR